MPLPITSTTDFIDQWHDQFLGVPGNSGDYAATRTRARQALQRVVNFVWGYEDWDFKHTSTTDTVTVASRTYGLLPADYLELGKWGGVFRGAAGVPDLAWIPLSKYNRYNRAKPGETDTPKFYTIGGLDTSLSPPQRKILLWPTPNANYSLAIDYAREAPHIDDASAGGGPNSATDELNLIPRTWLEGPIMEGMQDFYYRDDANAQSISEQRTRFMDWLKQMKQTEQKKHVSYHLPPWGRRNRLRGNYR